MNLKPRSLGKAIDFYTENNDNRLPPLSNAMALRRALRGYLEERQPGSGPPLELFVEPRSWTPYRTNSKLSWKRIRPLREKAAGTVLLAETDGDGTGGICVLLLDGRMKWMKVHRLAGAMQPPTDPAPARKGRGKRSAAVEWVIVGTVRPEESKHAMVALRRAGIHPLIGGSLAYAVRVPPEHRARAIEILKKDAADKGYWLQLDR